MITGRAEVRNLPEVQARFDRVIREVRDPSLVGGGLRRMFFKARRVGLREAREALDAGTATAVRSVTGRVEPLQMRIWSRMPPARAMSIEVGRSGGERVPIRQLINWRRTQRPGVPRAEELQRLIRARGTKGLRFIGRAREAINARMPEMVNEFARKVEKAWSKR